MALMEPMQVTNPAIDPYRESLVMSINVYLGRQGGRRPKTSGAERSLA